MLTVKQAKQSSMFSFWYFNTLEGSKLDKATSAPYLQCSALKEHVKGSQFIPAVVQELKRAQGNNYVCVQILQWMFHVSTMNLLHAFDQCESNDNNENVDAILWDNKTFLSEQEYRCWKRVFICPRRHAAQTIVSGLLHIPLCLSARSTSGLC